jgi:hypothetical protein
VGRIIPSHIHLAAPGCETAGPVRFVARGEAGAAGDLDSVLEFEQKSFDAYMDAKILLESLFGCRVELVLADSIKPRLRPIILKEATYAPGF